MSTEQRLAIQIANLSLQNASQATQIDQLKAQIEELTKKPEPPK